LNGKDREWFQARFDRIVDKLDEHSLAIERLETKWSMVWKFGACISAGIALIISALTGLFWR